jgi:hypothetical protein
MLILLPVGIVDMRNLQIYDNYLLYKQDMLDCEESQIRDLTLDDFIKLKLYRDVLTSKRGCYRIKSQFPESLMFWKEDEVFCSFKY